MFQQKIQGMTFKLFLYEGTMTGKQGDFRLYGHSASSTKWHRPMNEDFNISSRTAHTEHI